MLSHTDRSNGRTTMTGDEPGYKERLEEQAALAILMQADAQRARQEYSEAVKWIHQITGTAPAEINSEIARRLRCEAQ